VDDFLGLEVRNREEFERWLSVARALLFALPRGLGDAMTAELSRSAFGVEVGLAEVRRLSRKLVSEAYPELAEYLKDPTLDILAANLCLPLDQVFQILQEEGGGGDPALVRDLVLWPEGTTFGKKYAKARLSFLRRLRSLAATAEAHELMGKQESGELYDALFSRDVLTQTGRIHGRLVLGAALGAEFLDLADAALKAALYALSAHGQRLVAVAEGQCVVSVPPSQQREETAEEIKGLAGEAASGVLGGMPVPCDAEWASRW
jgi:hypothetical protein